MKFEKICHFSINTLIYHSVVMISMISCMILGVGWLFGCVEIIKYIGNENNIYDDVIMFMLGFIAVGIVFITAYVVFVIGLLFMKHYYRYAKQSLTTGKSEYAMI